MKKKGLFWRLFNKGEAAENIQTDVEPQEPQPLVVPQIPAEPTEKTETHKVVGVSFCEATIISMAHEDDDYSKTKQELIDEGRADEWIYKYFFCPRQVKLVPEPDNPQDPKAIRVEVDRQHIGYIKSGSCAHVHRLIKTGKILKVTCEIGGGPRKMVEEDFDDFGRSKYNLEKDSIPFYATLSVVVSIV